MHLHFVTDFQLTYDFTLLCDSSEQTQPRESGQCHKKVGLPFISPYVQVLLN